MKSNAIGIIGMGWVGASVAISILQRGLCKQLLLNDLNSSIAEGEAMDLNHGASFFPTAIVKSCEIEEMMDCRAIVITAGRGGKPGESRLDLLRENVLIARKISEQLKGYKGLLIIVSNPVDVLTYFYQKFTGLPKGRVIGTGTMLDTARLRSSISDKIDVDVKSIHANVIGEHGDSEVVLWSSARVGELPLDKWTGWEKEYEEQITVEVRKAAYEIIKRKGATNHAIGLVTATLLKWLLRGDRRICNVSSVVDGTYGLDNVAISIPTLIDEHGVCEFLEVDLSTEEREKLLESARILKEAIESVEL
ncbi:MAG: L-lactate dehydrogenase [Bacteroidota bacterium]